MTFFMDISVKGFSSRNLLFSFIFPPQKREILQEVFISGRDFYRPYL